MPPIPPAAAILRGFVPVAATLAVVAGTAAMARAAQPSAPTPSATTTAAQPGVELGVEPYRLDSVGLSINLPAGALAQATRVGDQVAVQVTPTPPDSGWLINIQTPESADREMTIAKVADKVLEQLMGAYGVVAEDPKPVTSFDELKVVSTHAKVLRRERDLIINGQPAERFYVQMPQPGDRPMLVRGYTVFRVGPGQFVTFDLITTAPEFAKARLAYETSLATARFVDPADLAASRGAAIEAGIALLKRLTPADLDAVVEANKERWFRLYVPAPTGSDSDAREVAYRRVRAWKGRRGEMDPRREPAKWTATERQEGYLVEIISRYLYEGQTVDSRGIYFLSTDRNEEAWLLKMAVKPIGGASGRPTESVEVGARSGTSMEVTTSGTGQLSEVIRPVVPREGYLSQLESFLLPQLAIRAGAAAEYGFYAYQSAHGNVRLRREALSRAKGPGGTWEIGSKLDENRPPQVSLYSADGQLIKAQLPDGTVWEPIELNRLVDLWRSKGMPMD